MDDEELSRLLGLLSDRTALTGEVAPRRSHPKVVARTKDGSANGDTCQLTTTPSAFEETGLRLNVSAPSSWYTNCSDVDEISHFGHFVAHVATEREWEHARRADFAQDKSQMSEESPAAQTTTPDAPVSSSSSSMLLHLDDIPPREWPHVPGKDASSWDKIVSDVDAESLQLQCVSKLLALPPGTLRYEPIDAARIAHDILAYLRDHGIHEGSSSPWTVESFRGCLVLLAFGIQLQSASILHDVAFLFLSTNVASVFPLPRQDDRLYHATMDALQNFPFAGSRTRLALPVTRCLIGSWHLDAVPLSPRDALATDGRFLYVFGRAGLFKVGTGAGETVRNMVYLHNPTYCRSADVERSWLCLVGDHLYCRTIAMPGNSIDRISLDFATVTPLFMAGGSSSGLGGVAPTSIYALVSDGKSLFAVTCRDIVTSQPVSSKTPTPPTLQRSKAKRKERAAAAPAVSVLEANPIQVGNRVVRGPDWKWSNQDGEAGSPGTVERISTWGGVQGSGITVRWDKNQRMNTYRWGAEGSFDIQIIEEDATGNILTHKPIKTDSRAATAAGGKSPSTQHQFIVYEYDPSTLETYLDTPDECMREMLQLPSGTKSDEVVVDAAAVATPHLSHMHEHPVGESDSMTPWVCDGQQATCVGPDDLRYRCLMGCDFDLCAACLEATTKPVEGQPAIDALADELPFSLEDDEFFKEEAKKPSTTEDVQVDQGDALIELQRAWQGQFGPRECAVALLKHEHNVEKASEWLVTSGALLKRRCIIPVKRAVVLEQNNLTFLDPVLLVAGSFYTTGKQLGIVIPVAICHVEPSTLKRRRQGDVLNVFSMATGSLLSDVHHSVTVPGGSPMCYDHVRDRVIGHAVHSAVVMEFTNMEHAAPVETDEPARTSPGAAILYHLARIVGLRHRLNPTYYPLRAIEAHLQLLERGKPKKRQVAKLKARYELMKLVLTDPPQGYFLPFCPNTLCLPGLAKHIVHAVQTRWSPDVVSHWVYVLVGFLEEAMSAEVTTFGSFDAAPLEDVLVQLATGECGPEYVTVTSRLAQRALLWGMIHQVFFASPEKLQASLATWCSSVDLSRDNGTYALLMPLSHPTRTYPDASAAKAGFTGSVLRTFASSSIFLKRLATSPQVWVLAVLSLWKEEALVLNLEPNTISPTQRLLFSIVAYVLRHPQNPHATWVLQTILADCKTHLVEDDRQFRTSLGGVVLPLIIASLAHRPELAIALLPTIEDLMVSMDTVVSTLPMCQGVESAYASMQLTGFLSPPEVVESPHPYGLGVPTFRQQIHFPGATALEFEFDPASCTLNANDFLFVTSNPRTNIDRLSIDHPFQGDKYCYGPAPWPSSSVAGDAATIVLCATTHPDDSTQDKLRYGIKCQARGLFSMRMPPILHVQHTLAQLCSKLARQLLAVESMDIIPMPQVEVLSTWSSIPDEIVAIANDVDHPFVQRLEKHVGRLFLRKTIEWRRCTVACLAVCLGVYNVNLDKVDLAELKPVVQHVSNLQRFMMQQSQIETEWDSFLAEEASKDVVIDRLAGNEELLQGLCSYLNVHDQTPEAIFAKLEEARTSIGVPKLPSTVQLVESRARMLLNRRGSQTTGQNASRQLIAAVNFLKSSVVPAEVDKMIAVHEAAARRRLTGLDILCKLLPVKSSSSRQFLIGALLHATSKPSAPTLTILDGCELCGVDLAAQLQDGLNKYFAMANALYESPDTLYSHKVVLGMELSAFSAISSHEDDLFPYVVDLLLNPPTWSSTASHGLPNVDRAKEAFTRNVKSYSDMLWMVLRRLLRNAVDIPLTTRLDACYTLFQFVTTAHDKARILDLVCGIVDRSHTLASNWASTLAGLLDFGESPILLRAARRLFGRLAPPQELTLVRRILHGIGASLSVEPPVATVQSPVESFGTVLYWANSTSEALIKLVSILGDQLEPEIPSWNISVDATSLVKQQLLLDTSIIHRYVQCDGCGLNPLVGHRFKCQSCSNFDLCTTCYVGNVHDLDHVFMRCTDTSGNTDQLPPRSSESLAGSRLWKSTLLHSELQAKGFAVLRLASEASCKSMAEEITSSLGLSCSVVGLDQIRRLQSLVPEKAASVSRNALAATVNAAAEPSDVHSIKQELASEYIAVVRKWLTRSSKTFDEVVACLKLIPGFSKGSKAVADMYEGIGAVAVLGGTVEPLRDGGYVTWNTATARVRAVLPQTVHLELPCGRVESNVPKTEIVPVSEVEIDADCAKLFFEVLYVFDDILQEIDSWVKGDEASTFKSDVSWRVLTALGVLVPLWPSVSDNQVLATYGCIPQTLMALAQKCPVGVQSVSTELSQVCAMTWMYLRHLHHDVALGPVKSQRPIPKPLNESSEILKADDNSSATYWYNMYTYASLADLPQLPGRNKLLDHWERHVIPAIQKYVRGSFKSYEMDYFFAQLREPLREGNNAAARRIAHTLCDGHVPPGCLFPDNDADWTALQWDDLAIGSTYRIELDVASAPPTMAWCHGHSGTIALIDPTAKLALVQVVNPDSASIQHWWLSVSQLQVSGAARPPISSFTDAIVHAMRDVSSRAVYKLARDCVVAIVRKCPDFVKVDVATSSRLGYALSDLLAVTADEWSPLASDKSHPIKAAIQFHQATTAHVLLPVVPKPKQKKSREVAVADDVVVFKDMTKIIGTHVSFALNKAMEVHKAFVVTSASPPEPLVHLHLPDVSWMVLTFFVHPVLMDLPAGSCMEIFFDQDCTRLIRGYYGGRKGLTKLPPLWVPSNSCYIKMSASEYARYKVRVDGIHGALGVATWLNDLVNDPHQWCTFLDLCPWPPLVQQVAFGALIPKMPRSVSPSLASKLKDQWKVVFAEERPVFSTYAQQLVEMLTVVHSDTEDVIQSFRRMTKFADAFADAKAKEGVVGRVPVDEIRAAVDRMKATDFFTDRLVILQKLPKTADVEGLVKAVSKWVIHHSLESCGEADDQSIFSAAEVTRFGILARVLYCPVDSSGLSIGYCVVDVGRDDIIDKLMVALTNTPFYFEGEHTQDDPDLMAFIQQGETSELSTPEVASLWTCASCTFENSADATMCNLCGTPNPNVAAPTPSGDASASQDGWTCAACTYLNEWDTPTCSVCGSECDQERPSRPAASPPPTDIVAPADGTDAAPQSATNQHHLSVLTFKAAYNAGHNRDPRVNDVLEALVPRPTAIELIGSTDVPLCPRERYMDLRSKGFGLDLTLGSFTSSQQAVAAMAKWTFAMDVQLIDAALRQCHRIGVPSLTQMSVSHLAAIADAKYPLLTALSLPELRLRFLILQQWNVLLSETLSLVDFHHVGVGAKLVTLRKLIFPDVKIRFLNLVQDNTTQGGEKKPTVVLDRLKWRRDPTVSLFELVQNQLMAVNPLSLRAKRPLGASDPFIAFTVEFTGENVVGEGGPYRQLFSDIAHECLRLKVFQPTPNAALKLGDGRDMVLPRPSATTRHELEQYEFVGLLMGCCLRTGVHLPVRLAPLVWKMLVHQPVGAAELKHIDQAVHDSLLNIQTDAALLEGLTFTTALSDGHVVELVPGGHTKPVTKENAAEYARFVTQTRVEECRPQVDAMLRGMGKIVPLQLLPLCTWTELQQWIGGSQVIDIELLKRHTKYAAGMTVESHPHLEFFWEVLHGFSEEDKRRFINFAWGQESLPADDAEFDRTRTRLLIKPPSTSTGQPQDSLLPKADTCFFNIELPAYSSAQVMKEKLHLAINFCMSMDADDPSGRMDVYFEGE